MNSTANTDMSLVLLYRNGFSDGIGYINFSFCKVIIYSALSVLISSLCINKLPLLAFHGDFILCKRIQPFPYKRICDDVFSKPHDL